MFKKVSSLTLIALLVFSFKVTAEKSEERSWKDEVIYSLMVDRFNNGNTKNDYEVNMKDPLSYNGGDFQGIIDKLDYLQEMGFTSIQLSPIFDNEENGYHGEWINNYYETEEHFGTIDEFKQLVNEVHDRGMKIIIEFPVTHVSKSHPWTKESDKVDWLQMDEDLPKLALNNPEVQQYLIDAAIWWQNETDIDGIQLGDVTDVPMEFLGEFSTEVKAAAPGIFLAASVSEVKDKDILPYYSLGFDAMADVSLNKPLREAFSKPDESLKPLFDVAENNQTMLKQGEFRTVFLDNKETERFTRDMVEQNEFPGSRWKLAFGYMYTQPEIPVIYYASEIAIDGGLAPENHPLMNFRTDQELIDHIKDLGKIRKDQKALRRGTTELLYENNGMTIFKREYEGDTLVIAINNTTKDQTATLTAEHLEDEKELRGLFGTDMVRSNNGEYKVFIERDAMEIYKLTNKSGTNILFILSIFAVFGIFIVFMYIAWRRGKNRVPTE